MNRLARFTSIILVLLSCTVFTLFQTIQPASTAPNSGGTESLNSVDTNQNPDFGRHFQDLGVEGSIMIVEKTPDYTIRAKTGTIAATDDTTPQVGWYVGYLEKGNNTYFFATNINVRNPPDLASRLEVTRRCFQDIKLL